MPKMRLVVIGGVAAGTKAASRARRVNPDLQITVYQDEPEISISECGLPYLISGAVEERKRLVDRTPEKFSEKDVDVHVRHRVERIDSRNKKLTVHNLQTREEFEDGYDSLIIATGARAVLPPIPGTDLEGVFTLRFLTDADAVRGYIKSYSPKHAVVVGAGYIGLEVAESLKRLDMEICVAEVVDRVAPVYSAEVSSRMEDHLKEKGVRVVTGSKVEALTGNGRVRGIRYGGEEIPAELIILGVGTRPEVELAKNAGVEIGTTGAIWVDKQLRTSLPDVWAAGDCAESVNLVTGEPIWTPLGDTANQMGRVAGTNAAGKEPAAEFPGVLGTGVFKAFELGAAKTGLSEDEAKEAGFDPLCAAVESKSRAGYYPGAEPVFLKLVADKESGRLLGAEAVGGAADKLVDVCATAIWGRLSYPDLVNLDLAYAPPFGPVLSPVIQAASVLEGKFEKEVESVHSTE